MAVSSACALRGAARSRVLHVKPETYRTVAAELRLEPDKIKGSRHVATVAPVDDEEQIAAVLARAREGLREANHHAYAWRLGRRGERFRYSDDGEPSGSAGRPILQAIEGRELTHLVVVVSRVFGGTKLGVGGLVRAYSGAAIAALDQAEVRVVVPHVRVRLVHDYALSSAVEGLLHAARYATASADYGERVTLELVVPEHEVEAFAARAREASAGRIDIETSS